MSQLQRRSSSLAAPSGGGESSLSTADLTFDGTFVGWEDLPASVRSAATLGGPEAASAIDTSSGKVKHRDGLYWQPWTGWQATRDGVVVAHLRRELRRGEGKKFIPTGRVHLDHLEQYPNTEPAKRRHGVVPNPVGAASRDAAATTPVAGDEGERLLGYVPPAVERETRSTVPAPTYSHGELTQWATPEGIPHRQGLVILRLGTDRAVVLSASRELDAVGADAHTAQAEVASLPWTITRYAYTLGSARNPVQARKIGGELGR